MAESNIKVVQRNYAFFSEFPEHHLTYIQDDRPYSSLHYHNCIEIGHCISGKGTMIINNVVSSFESGTITVLNEGCIHDSHILSQTKDEAKSVWRYIFIRPELVGVDVSVEFAGFASNDKYLLSLFEMMYNELESAGQYYRQIFSDLLSAFLHYSERIVPKRNAVTPSSLSQEMAIVISNIHAHYNLPLQLTDMAQTCNMSVSSFCRSFKSTFGISPIAYLNNLRLTVAKQLLETTTTPILEISSFVGYTSLSSFNRLFLKKYGCTPREVRKRASD